MASAGCIGESGVAVFLDRDGVINEERSGYVKSWREFRFLPGALEAMAALSGAGVRLFVITNQSAIHRGLASWEDVEEIHRRMVKEIERAGGALEAIFVCPHRRDENCECRKPRPGLLERAASEHGLDLQRCYLIGDKLTDIAAGQAVGCQCVLVRTGLEDPLKATIQAELYGPYHICRDVRGAVAWVLEREREVVSFDRSLRESDFG